MRIEEFNASRLPVFNLLIALLMLYSCQNDYQPKPHGYFRIGLPTKEYAPLKSDCPYSFEMNKNARFTAKNDCWADINYPGIRADLQLTYKNVSTADELEKILIEAQDLAYKHTVKAEGIGERLFINPEKKVYGIFYMMAGNAASSAQFYMTDSTNHFLRGVLYFYSQPNADSLKPAAMFMQSEMMHLVETLEWKN